MRTIELTTLVVICTDCIGSCKSNYHTMTTPTISGSLLAIQTGQTIKTHTCIVPMNTLTPIYPIPLIICNFTKCCTYICVL